jgi:hypothetical protein
MRVGMCGVVALVTACGGAVAQNQPPTQPARPADRLGQPADQGARARSERLLRASRLPAKAEEVRRKGVPSGEVKEALEAAKAKGVKADEMAEVADSASKDVDQHGRIDNFGSFVKSKLNEGLRGRELAAAIHEEHARRGMGKGHKADQGKGAKPDKADKADKPARDDAGKRDDRDSDERGKPADRERGKPEGKPDNKGGGQGKGRGKPG